MITYGYIILSCIPMCLFTHSNIICSKEKHVLTFCFTYSILLTFSYAAIQHSKNEQTWVDVLFSLLVTV